MRKLFPFLLLFFLFFTTSAFSQWWVDGGNLIWPNGDVSITNGVLSLDSTLNGYDISLLPSPNIGSDYFKLLFHPSNNIPGQNNGYFDLNLSSSDYNEGGDDFGKFFLSASPEEGISLQHWAGNSLDGSSAFIFINESYGTVIANESFPIFIGDYYNNHNKTLVKIDDPNSLMSFNSDSMLFSSFPGGLYFSLTNDFISADNHFYIGDGNGYLFDIDGLNYNFRLGDLNGAVNGSYFEVNDGSATINLSSNTVNVISSHIDVSSLPSDSTSVSSGELYVEPVSGYLKRKF